MILCVGCSWTYGHSLNPKQTYPAHIQRLLNISTINAGSCGTDIQYSIWSAYKLSKKYNIDKIFFQLTTLDRLTMPCTGKQNFLKNNYYSENEIIETFEKDKDYKRIKHFNNQEFSLLTVASYLESVKDKSEKAKTIKYLTENSVFDSYTQDNISTQLYSMYEYFKNRNIKVVFFPWLTWPQEFFNTTHGNFLKPLIKAYSVQEFITDNNLENLYIDNGFHLSGQGNKILVEEYLKDLL